MRSFQDALVSVSAVLVTAIVFGAPAAAQDGSRFATPGARASQPGGALPPAASPRAALQQYLRAEGRDEATTESVIETSRSRGRQGITHARFEQRAGGLAVFGTYARVALNEQGSIVRIVENLATVPRSVERARINEREAITAAIANLYPTLGPVPANFFRSAPTATRVAIPYDDGTMRAGFLVETWTQRANELNETLVDGGGAVLEVESRTNRDQYNVFRVNPDVTPQAMLAGAGASNAQSPIGWLFGGAQGSTHIRGNNANAYLDAVSNNRSDAEGDAIANGVFNTVADLTVAPSTTDNREVAVQNLFFLNNLIHDELYRHGFTEAAGNFQEENFGEGGSGSDSVLAEAQDGGGTDNANFATPRDGQNPRMQMYLWTGRGTHEVRVGDDIFQAQGAEFGPELSTTGVTGSLQLVNDGNGTTSDACQPIVGSLAGAIAIVDRGTCTFTDKVKNAQNAGALGVIVANNAGDSIITMSGTDRMISIPSVFVAQSAGTVLKGLGGSTATIAEAPVQPLSRDGDVDADIVFHEYCHGLTWRMIGRMSGPLAGAIGEGMSDVCAILMNSDEDGAEVIAEYATSDPAGIRRHPYDAYPLRYGDVTGASVHDDGEIYAAIGWRLLQQFVGRKDVLFAYLVDGMNFTPAQPTYEQMRDGILASVQVAPDGPDDECLVWEAFAQFGVGEGASGRARGRSVTITESSAVPAVCTP